MCSSFIVSFLTHSFSYTPNRVWIKRRKRPCPSISWAFVHRSPPAIREFLDHGVGDLPTEHEDGAGGGIVRQRQCLLQAKLLTPSVKAIRAINALGVIIASWAVLHGFQFFRTLFREKTTGWLWFGRWQVPSFTSHTDGDQTLIWPVENSIAWDYILYSLTFLPGRK